MGTNPCHIKMKGAGCPSAGSSATCFHEQTLGIILLQAIVLLHLKVNFSNYRSWRFFSAIFECTFFIENFFILFNIVRRFSSVDSAMSLILPLCF